jgi:hypothetical protein
MPFITQVLLPIRDNRGRRFAPEAYRAFHGRMVDRYDGWTRKGRAEGAWLSPGGEFYSDEHWVYEIVHANRDLRWWQAEKERLKAEFEQEEIWIVQFTANRV